MKWAHKISAPAVNNVESSSVTVSIEPDRISIRGEHSTKSLMVDIPLRHRIDATGSSWTLNTFGVNLVLRKEEMQSIWSRLLGEGVKVMPRNRI